MELVRKYSPADEALLRVLITPVEELSAPPALFSPWNYRWFRSAIITPIEHWQRIKPQPSMNIKAL
jgi:hypothetical protein